jgi:hypothetical protein
VDNGSGARGVGNGDILTIDEGDDVLQRHIARGWRQQCVEWR